jgi:fimbrial chaperone protein
MMFRGLTLAAVAMAALCGSAGTLSAAQLRVEPVLLELNAPAAAGSLTLRNDEDADVVVQTRVMRWSQADGKETLEPTADVVASPPTVKLAPGADYVVRVVRVSKRPVRGEESYRVIIDQLPNARRQQARAVNLLIRHSIPVFFRNPQLSTANVAWSLGYDGDKLVVVASNSGDERLRIASLRLRDATGATISFGNGLVGYALGRSSMSWIAPSPPRGFGASGSVSIAAETDKGPINAMAQLVGRR